MMFLLMLKCLSSSIHLMGKKMTKCSHYKCNKKTNSQTITFVHTFICPCRLLHWTEYSPSTPSSQLYQLNLTNHMITSLISSSRKREIDISSLEPTGALVWDTVTERLWLSDRLSGDIVSCDLNGSGQLECQVEVNNTLLPYMDTGKIYMYMLSVQTSVHSSIY